MSQNVASLPLSLFLSYFLTNTHTLYFSYEGLSSRKRLGNCSRHILAYYGQQLGLILKNTHSADSVIYGSDQDQ